METGTSKGQCFPGGKMSMCVEVISNKLATSEL